MGLALRQMLSNQMRPSVDSAGTDIVWIARELPEANALHPYLARQPNGESEWGGHHLLHHIQRTGCSPGARIRRRWRGDQIRFRSTQFAVAVYQPRLPDRSIPPSSPILE